MTFTRYFNLNCRWRSIARPGFVNGLEQVQVDAVENNIIAASTVIGGKSSQPFGIFYSIICAADWAVRSFKIENTKGHALTMNADGEGNWYNEDGTNAPQFAGAIDIDLSGTPFTCTLPIRRMKQHKAGESERFKMLRISLDDLSVKIDKQQYTCLIPYKKYRRESRALRHEDEFFVDDNAIVHDYPKRYIREILEETK